MTVVTTVSTTTSGGFYPTRYGNQRKIDRTSNGVLWIGGVPRATDGAGYNFWYSLDDGATWTKDPTGIELSFGNAGESSFYIDVDDYAHFVYKSKNNGYTQYQRGTPNADRTAWTWSTAIEVGFANGTGEHADIVAHREGTGWVAHIVFSYAATTSSNAAYYTQVAWASDGTPTKTGPTALSVNYNNTNEKWPSIDFHHIGDGKTIKDGTPHLYAGWTAGQTGAGYGIRFKKATYSAGSWTWGAERELHPNYYIYNSENWMNGQFDGTRFMITGCFGSVKDVIMFERDAADTTTTVRELLLSPVSADQLNVGNATYTEIGDMYIFGRYGGTAEGSTRIYYRKWTRATDTLSDKVSVATNGTTYPYVVAKRGYSDRHLEIAYMSGSTSPFSLNYKNYFLSEPPTTSNVSTASPEVKAGRSVTINWNYSDPDGDPQTKYQFRWTKV